MGHSAVGFYERYGTHQLQLKRDTRGTRKGNECYTRVFLVIYTQLHAMQIIFAYIGLHASSLLVYTQRPFLHAHVYACARVSTVNSQENLKPTIKYNAFIHVY